MTSVRMLLPLAVPVFLLASCNPPAADSYAERGEVAVKASKLIEPIASPDVEDAIWAEAKSGERIVFGKPGEPPLFALACKRTDVGSAIELTRFTPTDEGAKALIAIIGNGHIGRYKVDAVPARQGFYWHGQVPANDYNLEAFRGPRTTEATVPGGGSLILNANPMVGELIDACQREEVEETEPVSGPDKPVEPTVAASPAAEAAAGARAR